MLWQPSNKLPSGWWLGDALRSDCMMLKPHAALHSHFRRTSVLFKSFINRVLLLLIANKVASNLEIYFNCEDLDLEWTCHVSIDPLTVQCWNQLSFGKCRCCTKNCLNLSFKCPQLLLFLHICGCLIPGDFRDACFLRKKAGKQKCDISDVMLTR